MRRGNLRCKGVALAVFVVWLGGCQQFSAVLPKFGNKNNVAYKNPPQAKPEWTAKVKPEQTADVQMAVARSLEGQGQTDQAIKIYLEVVKKDSRRADAYHRLAVLHDKKGEHQSARKYYEIALKKDPKNAELHCDLGYSDYLQQRWKESESSLRRAVALSPDLARAHNNLGLVLARRGREDEALREFAKAGCTEAGARSNLAFVLTLDKRWKEAQRQYELALAADPSSAKAKEGLAALALLNQDAAPQQAASPESGTGKRATRVAFVAPESAGSVKP